jgi:uncharacterized protein (TIGR02246 family)
VAVDDIEEIKKLKARYFRCLDTKDWDGYRDVFTDDVTLDLPTPDGSRGTQQGIDIFMDYVRALTIIQSVHHGHMPEIELTSPDTATGIWAMEDHVQFSEGYESHGYGHYHETYEKADDRWRIKAMKLSYLRMDVSPYSPG